MIHRGSTGILMLHDPIHGLISQSPHGEDIQIGIVFQPFPQAVDVYIHGADIRLGIQSPDLVNELLPCEDFPRIGGQLIQQQEFLLWQRPGDIPCGNAHVR